MSDSTFKRVLKVKYGSFQQVTEHFFEMLSAQSHSLYLSRHRVAVIITRVRLVSACFALLTLLWAIVDSWVFPSIIANELQVLRVVSVIGFCLIAWNWKVGFSLKNAYLFLLALLANPLIFYVASLSIFSGAELSKWGSMAATLYEYLPFIVMAGLSVFPLTVLEAAVLVLPVVGTAGLGPLLAGSFSLETFLPTVWIMVVISGVYILSGMIQIHYMVVIVNKAAKDVLTGAFTRRSGEEIIDLYFRISEQHGTPFSIFFVDLDHFKSINDNFGHEAGDDALRMATQNLQAATRVGDVVIRWGGEEFIVVLLGTDSGGAHFVINRILENWLGERPDGEPLTASMGLAERIQDQAQDWPRLVEIADKRMYTAKESGRARCVMGGGEVLTAPEKVPAN